MEAAEVFAMVMAFLFRLEHSHGERVVYGFSVYRSVITEVRVSTYVE